MRNRHYLLYKIQFDDTFTMDYFRDSYKSAQDNELETAYLKFVPMNNVRAFLKEYEHKFSVRWSQRFNIIAFRYDSHCI